MLIVCFLSQKFRLYYFPRLLIQDKITIENIDFYLDANSKANNGFIGFYDWLRSDERTIVGLRLCFFKNQVYNNILMGYSYTRSCYDDSCIELLFTNGNNYSFSMSDDQDFSSNFVYKSDTDDYLITFAVDKLSEIELNSLLQICKDQSKPK